MASSAAPTSSAPKQFVPYFPTGDRACKILGRGNGSASGCMFAPRLQPKDGIRLRTSCSSSRSRVTCMSSDPKGAAAMVTTDSWDKSILGCEYPVLVEFYASWCGPCRMVHKVMDEIAREYDGKIKCYLLNTDQDLQIARDYDVKAVPVVMVFKGGEKRESVIGTMPKSFYEAAIRRAMDSS